MTSVCHVVPCFTTLLREVFMMSLSLLENSANTTHSVKEKTENMTNHARKASECKISRRVGVNVRNICE